MRMVLAFTFLAAMIVSSVSAGDNQDEQAAEMMKALGLAAGMTTGADIDVIGWRDLAMLLPKEIDGMESGKIDGGTFKMDGSQLAGNGDSAAAQVAGMAGGYSMVEKDYTQEVEGKGEKKISIRVMDSGIVTAMLAAFNMAVEYDTPDGLMKSVEIKGYPAKMTQEYDENLEIETTQYMVLISNRILVHFEGNELVRLDEVESLANNFPYVELEALAAVKSSAE